MHHLNDSKEPALRELTLAEIDQVSGGVIVVKGYRTYLGDSVKVFFVGYEESGSGMEPHPTLSPEPGGGGEAPPASQDCIKDNVANAVKGEINNAPQDGNERAALIYKDDQGRIVSTTIAVGAPGTVSVPLPPGVNMSQVIGFIHSHPTAPRSDDPVDDAIFDAADVYPSPFDWDQMDAMVAGGADPSTLSFYVVDMNGAAREYNYSDKAIYDVPEDQLLGIDGTPPPVPDPMTPEACQ
ncbi:MAG TPA: hypothetical protein VEW25_02485 [Allosphingosinicella sp.]|nr:hypothetical protein [Allosphingosinicella sp.]